MYQRLGFLNLVLLISLVPVLASDPPDSEFNPQTNQIESTDSFMVNSIFHVRIATFPQDNSPPQVLNLSTNGSDDLSPRLEIQPDGDSWVVWYRDAAIDDVLLRRRKLATGIWSSELSLGDGVAQSRNPELLDDTQDIWVVFNARNPDPSIIVRKIIDEPDPIGLPGTVLHTTSFTGDLDTRIHYDTGDLWVSWVDSTSMVGWSEYDYISGTWSLPSFEDYSLDSVSAARGRIYLAANQ
jgi:hypothetical protein